MEPLGVSRSGDGFGAVESGADGESTFRLGDELRGERATMGKTLLDVQRDLRIKAAYIAAIEDLDLAVFPNPSFVSGYVRAYARYLHLDPEQVLRRFNRESGFVRPKEVALQPKVGERAATTVIPGKPGAFRMRFPLAEVTRVPLVPILSAAGSVAVLALLVGGLGYGGWTVLQNIQRVQFAPVDELPVAFAEVTALDTPVEPELAEPVLTELAKPVAATSLAELYRQQEVEVPILAPRDGPIAALDPDRFSPPAEMRVTPVGLNTGEARDDRELSSILAALEASLSSGTREEGAAPDAESAPATPQGPLVVVAERAAWVRVYLASGTIIFEQILERGETYSPPEGTSEPMIWAGNSGSVYVRIGDDLHGPLGTGTRAVRDVVLTPAAISERYAQVENVPGVLSQAIGPVATPAVGIQ
jgi:hypothetical protein